MTIAVSRIGFMFQHVAIYACIKSTVINPCMQYYTRFGMCRGVLFLNLWPSGTLSGHVAGMR
jgi:hypothetical protein